MFRGRQGEGGYPSYSRCASKNVLSILTLNALGVDSRAYLTASYRSLLRGYILSAPAEQPPPELVKLLSLPRIRHVDLSYLDETSGRTLLHEAVRRKDLRLVELAVRAGADIFARDRNGKAVYDSAGKDDRVKAFLRQCK